MCHTKMSDTHLFARASKANCTHLMHSAWWLLTIVTGIHESQWIQSTLGVSSNTWIITSEYSTSTPYVNNTPYFAPPFRKIASSVSLALDWTCLNTARNTIRMQQNSTHYPKWYNNGLCLRCWILFYQGSEWNFFYILSCYLTTTLVTYWSLL
jgi:hypothetical protein